MALPTKNTQPMVYEKLFHCAEINQEMHSSVSFCCIFSFVLIIERCAVASELENNFVPLNKPDDGLELKFR